MTRFNWPIRIRRPERRSRAATYVLIAVVALIMMAVSGLVLLNFLTPTTDIPELSQAEKDEFWLEYIAQETDPNNPNPPSSRPDPTKLCGNMQRVAEGKRPTGGKLWPTARVAQRYVSALCNR